MAIEAMEQANDIILNEFSDNHEESLKAIQACKEALEQPAQEPWGWYENHDIYDEKQSDESIALYTHPAPSWQGLSDDEKKELFELSTCASGWSYELYADFIEQALKEKNT